MFICLLVIYLKYCLWSLLYLLQTIDVDRICLLRRRMNEICVAGSTLHSSAVVLGSLSICSSRHEGRIKQILSSKSCCQSIKHHHELMTTQRLPAIYEENSSSCIPRIISYLIALNHESLDSK